MLIKKNSTTNKKLGMTLVEVMVATVLAVVGLSSFLAAFSSLQHTSRIANNRMMAMHRAREILEYITSQTYQSNTLNIGTHTLPDATYTVTLASGYSDVKNISVNVPWLVPSADNKVNLNINGSVSLCLH